MSDPALLIGGILVFLALTIMLLRLMVRRPVVICDASVLIALARIKQFTLLRRVFGRLFVPPEVWTEVRNRAGYGPGAEEIQRATWIRLVPCATPTVCHS